MKITLYNSDDSDLRRYGTDGLPTMQTRRGADGATWWFTCPACGECHAHGEAGGPGPRASHCRDRDAYPQGYFIEAPDDVQEPQP